MPASGLHVIEFVEFVEFVEFLLVDSSDHDNRHDDHHRDDDALIASVFGEEFGHALPCGAWPLRLCWLRRQLPGAG